MNKPSLGLFLSAIQLLAITWVPILTDTIPYRVLPVWVQGVVWVITVGVVGLVIWDYSSQRKTP